MGDRRGNDRRTPPKVEEAIERKSERRDEDRRDSPRVPMKFLVRDAGAADDKPYEERDGDLSIGGIYWRGKSPPLGTVVDVRFRLPGVPRELRAKAELIRVTDRGGAIDFHVRFTELDVQDELAVARYIDEQK